MNNNLTLVIVLMGLVTLIPRIAPICLLGNRTIPTGVLLWLKYVPLSIMAALLSFILAGNVAKPDTDWFLPICLILPTFFIALRTKSLSLTLLGSMAGLALIRYLI